MADILQVVGAVLVLLGFFGTQIGLLAAKSMLYLTVNAVGSGVLAVLALLGHEWGFLLLEGVWCLVAVVSLAGVLGRARRHRPHLLTGEERTDHHPPADTDR